MRAGHTDERRIEGAEARVVALAAVHVADEGLVGVAPADPTAAVHVHRPPVGADLGQDPVLADVDALVGECHRGSRLLAAEGTVLEDHRHAADDPCLLQDDVDRVVRVALNLLKAVRDLVEGGDRQAAREGVSCVGDARQEAAEPDPVQAGDRDLVRRPVEMAPGHRGRGEPAFEVGPQRGKVRLERVRAREALRVGQLRVCRGAAENPARGVRPDPQIGRAFHLAVDLGDAVCDRAVDRDQRGLEVPLVAQADEVAWGEILVQHQQSDLVHDEALVADGLVEPVRRGDCLDPGAREVALPDRGGLGFPAVDGGDGAWKPEHARRTDEPGGLAALPFLLQAGEVLGRDPVVAHVGPLGVEGERALLEGERAASVDGRDPTQEDKRYGHDQK